jgi:uncharacterized protein involved in cysteine biosynthesis
VPIQQIPWYLKMFQWAQWISMIIYPLVAIAVVVILFLLLAQARRYIDYVTGTVEAKKEADKAAQEGEENVATKAEEVDVKELVE